MAKFDKDEFLNEITNKVKDAIENNLLTNDDIKNNDVERLEGFIQYSLSDYIEDRKMALDILKDFNYDERFAWEKLENVLGEFKSLTDIALVNLWKFLESQGLMNYSYYTSDNSNRSLAVDYEEDEFEDEGHDDFDEDDFVDSYEEEDYPTNSRRRYIVK